MGVVNCGVSVMLAVLVGVGAGCANGDEPAAGTGSVAPTAGASQSAIPPSLDFEATLTDGSPVDTATLADEVNVFWFWAPT